VEQSLGLISAHHNVSGTATAAVSENRNVFRIAIEVGNVLLDPLECQYLILKAGIPWNLQAPILKGKKSCKEIISK